MEIIMTEKKHTEIDLQGECALGFESVRDALAESFVSRDEIGSAICVYFEGKKVVDLWGGYVDGAQNHPWKANTLCLMYSVAKSICSLSVHMLADRGQIDLEAPIAEYWPEFAQAGKEEIKVRHFLSHWCGVWANDRAIAGDIYDPEAMEKVIAMQSPAWPIETQGAYNTVNIGFIANEIVRRVTDKSIQNFIADEITKPLGVDYYLGVPENALDRCAEIIANPADQVRAAGRDPDSPVVAAWKAFPKNFGPTEQNSYRFRTAGVPSFGGFGEARAMAKIYAVLAEGGELDGVRLLSSNGIRRAIETQWSDMHEGLFDRPLSMSMGFMKNPPDGKPLFTSFADSFGHMGSGGARAFAVPSKRLSGCFVSNYQSEGRGIGERTEAFVKAVEESVALP
ncbi:MAG: hypothetical protein CMM38_10525 [Rhodospirillaceae bacterium]|nr:hypothetical protein [Rhodospirillaceae bacterium]|tara:strand:+ start:2163 stop:3350 length:1188 start_codon:yes stop_codon:yes gene_type:complete